MTATAEAEYTAVWSAQPGPQSALIECPLPDLFYGGARGGGKTDGFLGDWIAHSSRYGRHATGVFIRRTYDELTEAIKRAHDIFPPLGAKWHESTKTWTMRNGAEFRFRYLERDSDASQYLGWSITWLAIDQAEQFPSPEPINKLWGILRSAQGIPCVRRISGNPGGPGQAWLRAQYIDAAPPFTPFSYRPQPVEAPDFEVTAVFIPARLEDNVLLRSRDPGYEARLAAVGGPELYRAWRHGDWDVIAGVMFSELRERLHCEDPRLPLDWTAKEITLDYGYSDMSHALWIETGSGMFGSPHSWVYRELVVNELPPPILAQMIYRRTLANEQVRRIIIDTNAWATPQDGGPAPAEQMIAKWRALKWDVAVVPATKGQGSRRRGWSLLHTYFYPRRRGGALLRVMRTCPVLWRQLTSLARGIPPHDPEDLEDGQIDHGADSLRYWVQGRPEPAQPTEAEILLADPDLDKFEDPRSYEAAQIERIKQTGFPAVPVRRPARPQRERRPY